MSSPDFSTTLILLKGAQSGQADALNDLLTRYAPRIRQAVPLYLGHLPSKAADIEDVVQEVLLAAFKNIDRFEVRSDASFMAWLVKIVASKAFDLGRFASRQKHGGGKVHRFGDLGTTTHAEPPIADRGPTASQIARANEFSEAEQEALIQLPENHRLAIIFRHLLEMSYEEMGPLLGYKSADPARALYSAARKRLAKLLRRFDPRADATGDGD